MLAVSVAGFALDIDYIGPNTGVRSPVILERRRGAFVTPLGAPDSPGGCSEVSLRIKAIKHLRNPLTGRDVDVVIVTNSLASNNHAIVHSGYAPKRKSMLRAGVRLLDLRTCQT